MPDKRTEWKTQYDALLQGKIDRLQAMSPEARDQLRGQFSELCHEMQGVLEEDPAGPRAQELAGKWLQLLGAFVPNGGRDPQLLKYAAAYLSNEEWPVTPSRPRIVWAEQCPQQQNHQKNRDALRQLEPAIRS
jgi:hypothetical protein